MMKPPFSSVGVLRCQEKVCAFEGNSHLPRCVIQSKPRLGRQEMKNRIIMITVLALVLPLMAQETDNGKKPASDATPTAQESRESAPDRGEEFRARQVKLMEKSLKEIGVTEEQRTRIFALQEEHMAKMKANWQRLNEARVILSKLQDESASMEEIDEAIQKVADAQAEQLRLFAHNRREMEQILGKEKNDRFMKNARKQFRRHGRRPGPDMPPRPGAREVSSPPLPPGKTSSAPPALPTAD